MRQIDQDCGLPEGTGMCHYLDLGHQQFPAICAMWCSCTDPVCVCVSVCVCEVEWRGGEYNFLIVRKYVVTVHLRHLCQHHHRLPAWRTNYTG